MRRFRRFSSTALKALTNFGTKVENKIIRKCLDFIVCVKNVDVSKVLNKFKIPTYKMSFKKILLLVSDGVVKFYL